MKKPAGKLIVFITFASLSGCTSLTTQQREERDYRNFDYVEQFKYDRRKCQARGGRIIVDAIGKPDRDGVPRFRERYICA